VALPKAQTPINAQVGPNKGSVLHQLKRRLESRHAMWRTEGANPLRAQRVNLSGTKDRGSGNLDGGRPVARY